MVAPGLAVEGRGIVGRLVSFAVMDARGMAVGLVTARVKVKAVAWVFELVWLEVVVPEPETEIPEEDEPLPLALDAVEVEVVVTEEEEEEEEEDRA